MPKACNFHVQMPGSLNWRTKHARKMFTRCGLGAACWLRDGFDLGKRRRRSSTPAVVPGAAPALAKAGVGGYIYIYIIYIYVYIHTCTALILKHRRNYATYIPGQSLACIFFRFSDLVCDESKPWTLGFYIKIGSTHPHSR